MFLKNIRVRLEEDLKEVFIMQACLIMGKFAKRGITDIKQTTLRVFDKKEMDAIISKMVGAI
jgi:uncharacterized protein with GYD domain